MKRGEVWWAKQPEPVGRRPVLLSCNEAYGVRNAVTIAQITTTIRHIPVEVMLGEKDGLPQKCVANLDTVTTIKKDTLLTRICYLKEEKILEINKALMFALGLD
jgi:mRNA interferase MazF